MVEENDLKVLARATVRLRGANEQVTGLGRYVSFCSERTPVQWIELHVDHREASLRREEGQRKCDD